MRTHLRVRGFSPVLLSLALLPACSSSDTTASTPNVGVSLTSPEGGQVRLERIVYTDGSIPPFTSLSSYFMKSEDPGWFPLLGQPGYTGKCYDGTDQVWPLAQGATRKYLDVGTMTITDGVNPLTLKPQSDGTDDLLHTHSIFYGHFVPDADTYAIGNHTYDVSLTGSDSYPATSWKGMITMPGNFQAVTPPPDAKSVTFNPNEDFTIEISGQVTDPKIYNFAFFFRVTGGVPAFCVDEVPGDGRIIIPAATIQKLPPTGIVLRGQLVQKLVEFNDQHGTSGRRIDMLGVSCVATPYTIQQPTPQP